MSGSKLFSIDFNSFGKPLSVWFLFWRAAQAFPVASIPQLSDTAEPLRRCLSCRSDLGPFTGGRKNVRNELVWGAWSIFSNQKLNIVTFSNLSCPFVKNTSVLQFKLINLNPRLCTLSINTESWGTWPLARPANRSARAFHAHRAGAGSKPKAILLHSPCSQQKT